MAPFDSAAPTYDANARSNLMMRWLRRTNLRNLYSCFSSGEYVLEIGCGSGEEAIALGRRGVRVLATDASPLMVEIVSGKLAQEPNMQLCVQARVLAAEQLLTLGTEQGLGAFDGAYSSLGPLNCIPDLQAAATNLARLVRPGGVVAISLLGKYCVWETAWYLLHMQSKLAFRRWSGRAAGTAVPGSGQLAVYYWPYREIERFFRPYFEIRLKSSLPWALPPTYAEGAVRHSQLLYRLLESVERATHDLWPFYTLGDHIYLEMVRKPVQQR